MFAKVFQQIFDSSIAHDYKVRRMFMDLLVLADSSGCVDITHEAIARRTGVPIEEVVECIDELLKPDPASRSDKANGARLVFIDSGRDWGWRIVNYDTYRKMRDEESRRSYCRDYMRDYMQRKRRLDRHKLVKQKSNKSNNGKLGVEGNPGARTCPTGSQATHVKDMEFNTSDLPSKNVKHPLDTLNAVRPCLTQEEEEEEEDKRPSAVSLAGRQPAETNGLMIVDPEIAKRLICEKILGGKDPSRPWSYDAMQGLARLCPLPLQEILDVAHWRAIPASDEVPELKKRIEPVTETGLMRFWSDEVQRAREYFKKYRPAKNRSEPGEPPLWREFFHWKYDTAIRLPESWAEVERDQREEYERNFSTFSNSRLRNSRHSETDYELHGAQQQTRGD